MSSNRVLACSGKEKRQEIVLFFGGGGGGRGPRVFMVNIRRYICGTGVFA